VTPTTKKRRPFIRFFACEEDISHDDPEAPAPDAVVSGVEPFFVIGRWRAAEAFVFAVRSWVHHDRGIHAERRHIKSQSPTLDGMELAAKVLIVSDSAAAGIVPIWRGHYCGRDSLRAGFDVVELKIVSDGVASVEGAFAHRSKDSWASSLLGGTGFLPSRSHSRGHLAGTRP